jgi:histidyl-tRNA synthetase
MTKIEPKIPKGMRDIEPADMLLRAGIIAIIREVFERYGFEPIETPALEYWEILTGKYGQEAERLVYHLTDHGGRELGLRYDLTVPLARYVAGRKQLIRPFKRYQIQPVWRAEKPQKGRYREFYQCDVDSVGSASMLVDSELIALTVEVMSRIGFKDFQVMVNNRKILQGIVHLAGIPVEKTAEVCQTLDKFDKIGREGVDRELESRGYQPNQRILLNEILDLSGGNEAILESLKMKLADSPVGLEGVAELAEILGYLGQSNVEPNRVRINPRLTRGLDYYTGPIYETELTGIAFSSLGGGGRYNGLVGIFSDEEIPAAGTSFGLDRIVAAIEELGQVPLKPTTTRVLVARISAEQVNYSLRIVDLCRKAGINAEIVFDQSKLKKQLTYADARGIPIALIAGSDEESAGQVQLKDLRRGTQDTVSLENLIQKLNELLQEKK